MSPKITTASKIAQFYPCKINEGIHHNKWAIAIVKTDDPEWRLAYTFHKTRKAALKWGEAFIAEYETHYKPIAT